eukprot:2651028-Pyramimonas_sp.AAC.1
MGTGPTAPRPSRSGSRSVLRHFRGDGPTPAMPSIGARPSACARQWASALFLASALAPLPPPS